MSETGLFRSVSKHVVEPALIPYSVNSPLWSDGAHKERFMALPETSQIDFTDEGAWKFPEGAVLVKTFSLELEAGNPASRRRIETRLLVIQQNEWVGYTYRWNDDETDAALVESPGADQTFTIRDPNLPQGRREQVWHYPSRAECMVCHSRAQNYVLGLCELQMNKDHVYPNGVTDNQLRVLEHLGELVPAVAEVVVEAVALVPASLVEGRGRLPMERGEGGHVPVEADGLRDVGEVVREQRHLRREVDAATLDRVKTKIRAGVIRGLDSNSGLAEQLTYYHVNYGDWRKLFTGIEDINKVTADDVQRVARARSARPP